MIGAVTVEPAAAAGEAQVAITDWKTAYNHDPHYSALGYLTPDAYAAHCTHRTLSTRANLPTG